MARKWLVTYAAILPLAFAFDDRSLIESRLRRLVSTPGYQEAFYRRVDEAFQNLSKPSADEAEASQRVQAVLVTYADRTIRLRFIADPGGASSMTSKVCGNRIFVNTIWLQKATENDLHSTLAHEVSHEPNDCIRFWLIEKSGLNTDRKIDLLNEIEMQADTSAIALLQRVKRNPRILTDWLRHHLPLGWNSAARVAAAERRIADSARTGNCGAEDIWVSHRENREAESFRCH